MAHSFTHLLTHITFSTRDRRPLIDQELKPRLVPYMGGIVREVGGRALAINGPEDHMHVLATVPPTVAVSDFMRVLKTNSSRWVHETWADRAEFGWQTGYGAFSVSESNCSEVAGYIARQEGHHRRMSFKEEFLALLRKHGMEFDERYVWE